MHLYYCDDAETLNSYTILYSSKPAFTTKTFKLGNFNYNYFEINNAYLKVKIYRSDDEVLVELDGDKENTGVFKFEKTLYTYYIQIELPETFTTCGFYLVPYNSNPDEMDLTSGKKYYFLSNKEIAINVKNENQDQRWIDLNVYWSDNYLSIGEVTSIENGENFVTRASVSYHSNDYYALLTSQLTFKINLEYSKSDPAFNKFVTVKLSSISHSEITKNGAICENTKGTSYYKLVPSKSDKKFYDISIKGTGLIYNYNNNINKNQITSSNKYDVNDYNFIFLNNTDSSTTCFSVVYFDDEKYSIKTASDISFPLLDSKNFDTTLIFEQKYIKIYYKSDSYFDLNIYLSNKQETIDYIYFLPTAQKYLFYFMQDSDEVPVQLQFVKKKDFTSYHEVQISIEGSDEKINTESTNIESEFFECVKETKFYNIKYKSDLPYIFLSHNASNDKIILDNASPKKFNKISKDSKLVALGDQNNKICFNLIYESNSEFILKPSEKKTLNVFMSTTFYFRFEDLIEYKNYTITIESENENIKFTNCKLTIIYEYTYELQDKKQNIIEYRNFKEFNDFEIPIELKNRNEFDKLTIGIFGVEDKNNPNTEDTKADFTGLINFSVICAYICFGIILIPLAVSLIIFSGNIFLIIYGIIYYPWRKFAAIYFCRKPPVKPDIKNKNK